MNKGEGTGGPAGIKHPGQRHQMPAAPWQRERPDGLAMTPGSGGVSKPGGDEADDQAREQYKATMRTRKGAASDVVPFALADLNDGDNNHLLCLDIEGTPESVSFPAGFLADPRGDLNPNTRAAISKQFDERSMLATGRRPHCLAWIRCQPSLSPLAEKRIRATAK